MTETISSEMNLTPRERDSRLVSLDVLRGFALLGILAMNIQSFTMPGAAYFFPVAYGDLGGANYLVWYLSELFARRKFMTLFYLTLDVEEKSIEWVRAGHDPAWLYHPDEDRFENLKGAGVALGVAEDYQYDSTLRTGLEKGHLIMIATDGLWEGHNKAGEMFGKQRVQAVIRHNADRNAAEIHDALFAAHRRFTEDAGTEDDLTLVIIKVTR